MMSINKLFNMRNNLIYEKYLEIIDNPYILSESNIKIFPKNVNIYVYNSQIFYEIEKLKERLIFEFRKINPEIEKINIKIVKKIKGDKKEVFQEVKIEKNLENIQKLEEEIKKDISSLKDEKIRKHLENITFQYIHSDYVELERCKKCEAKSSLIKDGICISCIQKEKESEFELVCNNILNDYYYQDNSQTYQKAREYLSEQVLKEILNMPEVLRLDLNTKEVDLKIIKYIKIRSASKDNKLLTEEVIRVKKYIKRIIEKNVK